VRRRLDPVERALPGKPPGYEADGPGGGAGGEPPAALGSQGARAERTAGPASTAPEDAAARIDAARTRLRATIEPPADPDA
jgi:hypothetical protein